MQQQLLFAVSLLLVVALSSTVEAFSAPASSVASKAPFTDDQVISIAREYLESKNGFYAPIDKDALADDFVFRAGVIGPLNKEDYCDTIQKLNICNAFEMQANPFGFCVDPDEPMSVRFFVRYTGRQVKPWIIANTPVEVPVSNEPIQGPTESYCIKLNAEGKVRFFTISNPMNFGNPRQPTTGQLGAVLGLLNHVGAPYAADAAMNPYVRKISDFMTRLIGKERGPPSTASHEEDIPGWWRGY